jgi:DNA processing protein
MIENIQAVLALGRLPQVGRVSLRSLLKKLASETQDLRNLSDMLEYFRDRLPPFSGADISLAMTRAEEILAKCESLGISVRPYGSPSYPSQLTRLAEPPAILFSVGEFDFAKRPRIAIIGTRKPTDWGLKTARACASQIAESHGVVVSGLALGIDSAAHAASVARRSTTWAILAHGLHTISPSSNRELAKQILETGGALVSEYAPGEPAQRHYFVERDRIQAGLADAVLVIESGLDGGAMHTVAFAQGAGVPVWVTFPQEKIRDANISSMDLPEPQQGTWSLLSTKKASRVPTVKALDRMLAHLSTPEATPTEPDTLFSL